MYYFEMLSLFVFFMLCISLFTPFFGGCLILSIFFLLFGGLVIFFSLNFIWFLAGGILIYGYLLLHKLLKWRRLPDINQYLHDHPECKLAVGVCCYKCHVAQLNNVGLFHQGSKRRFYLCGNCGTTLFRFKVL